MSYGNWGSNWQGSNKNNRRHGSSGSSGYYTSGLPSSLSSPRHEAVDDSYDCYSDPRPSTSSNSRPGGFVIGGRVDGDQAADVADPDPDDDVITLSSDEEDGNDANWGYDGDNDDIELVRVLPKAKSRLLPARDGPGAADFHGIDCTYDSGSVFEAAEVTDYGHRREEDHWSLDPTVKTGYVKEYVDQNGSEGLGMIFAVECGLILFSEMHLFKGPDGGKRLPGQTLAAGSPVNFLCYQARSQEFRGVITKDGFMRLAAAVWEPSFGGAAGQNLLRQVTEDGHKAELKQVSKKFSNHINARNFLPMALVRAKGQVLGYLNHKIGLLTTDDGMYAGSKVLFHTSDVYMFRQPLCQVSKKDPVDVLIPVGLRVAFDARLVSKPDPLANHVKYQACAVFAGHWPRVPHPTLLPGGPGSVSPSFSSEDTSGHTFYYLQLGLTRNLDRKWQTFSDAFGYQRGNFSFVPSHVAIRSGRDFSAWKRLYSPFPEQVGPKRMGRRPKSTNLHVFKGAPPQKEIKKEHLEEKVQVKSEPGISIKVER